MDVNELLRQGENTSIEFKMEEVRPETIAREMVAFSNAQGGVILLGVDDEGKVVGISDNKNHEEWVANIARNNIIPPIQPFFEYDRLDGKKIAVINIDRGKDKPYQSIDSKYYIRIGSTNRVATQTELLRLFQAAGTFHYDAVSVPDTSRNDLNLSKIDRYFQRYDLKFSGESEREQESLLINSDILSTSAEVTVGGLTVFGINPARYLPQCGIMFAHFEGEELDENLIDRKHIEGSLDYQVDTCLAAIKNNLLVHSKIQGSRRVEKKEGYEDKVFRELLTNACIHRNYSISGSLTRVLMFQNRIEFISPGRLPNTITIDKLKIGVSYAINPIILKFMDNLRYTDRLGRGLPMVYRISKNMGKPAVFKEIGEEFRVILSL